MKAPHEILNAMGDPSRMELVWRLATGGPKSLGRLTQGMPMSRQGATKHLRILEDVGLVQMEWRGRRQVVALQPDALRESSVWMQTLAKEWETRSAGQSRTRKEMNG